MSWGLITALGPIGPSALRAPPMSSVSSVSSAPSVPSARAEKEFRVSTTAFGGGVARAGTCSGLGPLPSLQTWNSPLMAAVSRTCGGQVGSRMRTLCVAHLPG